MTGARIGRGRRQGATGLAAAVAAAATLAVVTTVASLAVAPAAGADGTCRFAGNAAAYVFQPTTGFWDVPANWRHANGTPLGAAERAPGVGDAAAPIDLACVPAGRTAVIGDGPNANWVFLQAADIDGAVRTDPGARAVFAGPAETTAVRFDLVGAYLAGRGTVRVTGTFRWCASNAQSTGTCATRRSAATITTRLPGDGSALGAPGRLVIAAGATLLIDGSDCPTQCGGQGSGGVNLSDGRIIENAGTTIVRHGGYVAADWGTSFVNRGTYRIENDRGYYQGIRPAGATVRSIFRNDGLILKAADGSTAGPFLSVIDAAYRGSGRIDVRAGTLAVWGDAAPPSSAVAPNAGATPAGTPTALNLVLAPQRSVTNTGCAAGTLAGCTPAPRNDDRIVGTVKNPSTSTVLRATLVEDATYRIGQTLGSAPGMVLGEGERVTAPTAGYELKVGVHRSVVKPGAPAADLNASFVPAGGAPVLLKACAVSAAPCVASRAASTDTVTLVVKGVARSGVIVITGPRFNKSR